MKSTVAHGLVAIALAVSAVAVAATAATTASNPSQLDQTVRMLQVSGYLVTVDKVGTAPSDYAVYVDAAC